MTTEFIDAVGQRADDPVGVGVDRMPDPEACPQVSQRARNLLPCLAGLQLDQRPVGAAMRADRMPGRGEVGDLLPRQVARSGIGGPAPDEVGAEEEESMGSALGQRRDGVVQEVRVAVVEGDEHGRLTRRGERAFAIDEVIEGNRFEGGQKQVEPVSK